MNKIIEWHKNFDNKKQLTAFYIMSFLFIAFLIISIILLTLGINDYNTFVSKQIVIMGSNQTGSNNENLPDISMFVYGIFFVILAFLLLIALLLYGNSIFNKKYKKSVSIQ